MLNIANALIDTSNRIDARDWPSAQMQKAHSMRKDLKQIARRIYDEYGTTVEIKDEEQKKETSLAETPVPVPDAPPKKKIGRPKKVLQDAAGSAGG